MSKRQETMTIGGLLALFLVFWIVGFHQYVDMSEPPSDALPVYVTAKQWMWKFGYPDGRRSIGVLVVPAGRPVRLIMTSRDVIHSFYVPAFRIKYDVLPGRYTQSWFEATTPGAYEILCAEYCGVSHSRMRGTVVVLSQQDYDAWLGRGAGENDLASEDFENAGGVGEPSASNLVELGRTVASRKQCFACHTVDGQRHIGPTWRGLYGSTVPLSDGRTIVADEAYLTRSMMDPTAEIHAGFPAVMPTYQGVLQAPEAAAIVELIKSLREGEERPEVQLPTILDGGVVAVDGWIAPAPSVLPPIDAGDAGTTLGPADAPSTIDDAANAKVDAAGLLAPSTDAVPH